MSVAPLQSLRSIRLTFTGRLASLSRAEAERLIRAAGGEPVAHLSRRVSVLVVGMDGWPLARDGAVSSKLRRVEQLNREGRRIRIISELEFLELVGRRARRAELRKPHSAESVARMVGVDVRTLRHWEALGLVRSDANHYDFQDIVSLRVIVELVGRGVRADVISRSLHDLSAILPDTDRPLAQLRIVDEGPRSLLAELGDCLVAPDGQLVLNYESPAEEPRASRILHAGGGADDWFTRGLRFEESERYDEAAHCYRRALQVEGARAKVHFNLGNVLRELGETGESMRCFEAATRADPGFAEAWYNLADLQDERGSLGEAITSLRAALRARPDYADAHFNLSLCLERAARMDEARAHWRSYQALDGDGEWADPARGRVEGDAARE